MASTMQQEKPVGGGGAQNGLQIPVPTSAASAEQVAKIRKSFSKPSTWVVRCGALLAFCAGCVNVVCYFALGVFVSHLTGTTTKIGMRIEGVTFGSNTHFELRQAVLLVVSFISGSALCGFLVSKNEVHFGKALYGVALLINSGLLVVTVLLGGALDFHQYELASYCAAVACGLQNGMCTMHYGAVVRTTHVTGLATDLGSTLGRVASIFCKRRCRRSRLDAVDVAELEVDKQKLHVFFSIGLSFIVGSGFGAFIETYLGVLALLIPASITGLGGLAYTFFQERLRSWFRDAEASNLNEILEKTQSFLRIWQKASADTTGDKAADVDDQLSHTLEVLHDLEASLANLCDTNSHHSPWQSPKSPWRSPKSDRHSPKRVRYSPKTDHVRMGGIVPSAKQANIEATAMV